MGFLENLFQSAKLEEWLWLIEMVIGIATLIVITFLLKKLVSTIRKRSHEEASDWRSHIDQIVSTPLHIALWTIGVTYVLDVFVIHFGLKVLPHYITIIRSALLIICLSAMMLRWIKVSRQIFSKRSLMFGLDAGTVNAFAKIASFLIAIITALILLQILGLNVVPLLAFGGIGAAALGFAGKDVIANFFGGLMLHINRSFTTGESIIIPTQNNLQGTVEEIGWYTTSMRDLEKRVVYLPNALFSSALIVNLSRMTHRRILETLKIRSEDYGKLPQVMEEIQKMLKAHQRIDKHIPIHVVFSGYGEHSVDVMIDAYTHETNYENFLLLKQELLMRIQKILVSCDAELSVPSTYVHLRQV